MVDGGALLQRSANAEVAAFLNRSMWIIEHFASRQGT